MKFVNGVNEEDDKITNAIRSFDNTDFKIISLLVLDKDNKEISSTLKVSLSTIQRRTRKILQSGIVKVEYIPNFNLLGIKKGFLHTYLRDGRLRKTGEKISEMEGVLSASIHVGDSDIVSEFVYESSEDLVDAVADIKQIEGVERVLWSEEIFKLASHKENIMKSFNKYWKDNNNYQNNNNNHKRKNIIDKNSNK